MSEKQNSLSNTRIVAVGSGKGGVGKSTVTAGLAFALRDQGYSVGILDADIYGFSIPRVTGIMGQMPDLKDDKNIIPVDKDGVKIISMGSLVDETKALALRGPMLQGILQQFVNEVEWGQPDYLLIDLPPGTGDVAISLINMLPEASYIIVTTPQETSYNVAARLAVLTAQARLPVLGVIENMSYFECDRCGEKHYLFGQSDSAVEEIAQSFNSLVLGRIPLRKTMRQAADSGTMSDFSKKEDAREFREMASQIPALVEKIEKERPPGQEQEQPEKTACSLEGG